LKIAHIVGARPQFIKYFPVSEEINKFSGSRFIKEILIHTGQHYDYVLSKIFFDELLLRKPDFHLAVGSGSQGEQTGQIIQKVEKVLLKEKPNVVFVYGDTNSTLGSALAAAKLHIPVVHIEAGLRSFNKYMPEEINRILTDHISTILFCPSKIAVKNLKEDNFQNVLSDGKLIPLNSSLLERELRKTKAEISKPLVINVGDVMYDVLLHAIKIAEKKSKIIKELQLNSKNYYLLTIHRAENTDDLEKMEKIIDFVNEVSLGKPVVFPMHPRTRKAYSKVRRKLSKNVKIINPVSYLDAITLLKNSAMLMTDSGGMQKEAFWLKVPCITLRKETEWVETIQSGWNVLYKDYTGTHKLLKKTPTCYGDGRASQRIALALMKTMGEEVSRA
jgi:UDP-N-acetylglucosamine 2-epimerase